MRVYLTVSPHYYCCSTLALLNGDIHSILNERYLHGKSNHKEHLIAIRKFLKYELQRFKNDLPRKLKKEYKRMIALYDYRLSSLGDLTK